MGIWNEVEDSWRIYKSDWEKYLTVFAIIIAVNFVIILPMILLIFIMQFAFIGMVFLGLWVIIALFVIMALFFIVVSFIIITVQGAALACTRDIMEGTYHSYKDLWMNWKKYWKGIIGIYMLLLLISLVVMGVLMGGIGALIAIITIKGYMEVMMIGTCLLFGLFFVFYMFFAMFFQVLYLFAEVIYLSDECSAVKAVGGALRIIRKNPGHVLQMALVLFLAMMVSSMIPMVGQFAAACVVMPVAIIYLFRYYNSLDPGKAMYRRRHDLDDPIHPEVFTYGDPLISRPRMKK